MSTVPGGDYVYNGGGEPITLPIVVQSNEQGKILDNLFSSTLGNSTVTQSTAPNGTVVLIGSNGETVKVFSSENTGKVVAGVLTKNDAAVIDTDKTTVIRAGTGDNQVVIQGESKTTLNVGAGNDKVTLATDGIGNDTVALGNGSDKLIVSSEFQGTAIIKDFSKQDQLQIVDRTGDNKVEPGKDYTYYKAGKDTVLVLYDKAGKETTKITLKNVKTDKVDVSSDGILTIH